MRHHRPFILVFVVLLCDILSCAAQFVPMLPNTKVVGVTIDREGNRYMAGTNEVMKGGPRESGSIDVASLFVVLATGTVDTLVTHRDWNAWFDPLSTMRYQATAMMSIGSDSMVMLAVGGNDSEIEFIMDVVSVDDRSTMSGDVMSGNLGKMGSLLSCTRDRRFMQGMYEYVQLCRRDTCTTIASTNGVFVCAEVGSALFVSRTSDSVVVLGEDGVITPVNTTGLAPGCVRFDEEPGSLVGWTTDRVAWSKDSGRTWQYSAPMQVAVGARVTAAHRSTSGLVAYAVCNADSTIDVFAGDSAGAWERYEIPRYHMIGILRGERREFLTATTSQEMWWRSKQPAFYGAFRWSQSTTVRENVGSSRTICRVVRRGIDGISSAHSNAVTVMSLNGELLGTIDPSQPVVLPCGLYCIDRTIVLVTE